MLSHEEEKRGHGVLEDWFRRQNPIRRMLAPADFIATTKCLRGEAFQCWKSTTDYLERSVTESWEEWKIGKEPEYELDSAMLSYVPSGFQEENVRVAVDREVVICSVCRGHGYTPCPPTDNCRSCDGQGLVRCDRREDCSECNGTGRMYKRCGACDGFGIGCSRCDDGEVPVGRCRVCSNGRVTCGRCGGRGRRRCQNCGGDGEVVCRRCKGRGQLDCRECDRHGEKLRARLVNLKFTAHSTADFVSEGGSGDGFRNGLSAASFSGLRGELLDMEEQTPEKAGVVRQTRRLERFYVVSHCYQHRDREFFVNHLMGADGVGPQTASTRPPISVKRAGVATGIFAATVGLAIVVVLLLGLI